MLKQVQHDEIIFLLSFIFQRSGLLFTAYRAYIFRSAAIAMLKQVQHDEIIFLLSFIFQRSGLSYTILLRLIFRSLAIAMLKQVQHDEIISLSSFGEAVFYLLSYRAYIFRSGYCDALTSSA